MKKRLIALLLVIVLIVPAALASAATWYRVNTNSVKVRMQPGDNAIVLGSYRRDYAMTIKKKTSDGWAYVVFSNGFEGYVQQKYIKKASSYKAWIYADDTSLRRGPDGGFAATAKLARGTRVTVLSHGSKYDLVNAGSLGIGYVVNSLLSKKKITASGNASYSTVATGGDYDAWVMSDKKVNLRTQPSKTAPVIAQYVPGTKVHVISHAEEWDYISVDGNNGWMMNKFIDKNEPAPNQGGNAVVPANTGYVAYVVSENKKSVHVRKGPSTGYSVQFNVPYSGAVLVLEHGDKWDYIQRNGRKGYINNSFLQLAKPTDATADADQDPTVTPVPPAPFVEYDTTVKVNDLNFHKQKGDWSSNVDGVGRLQAGWTVHVLAIDGDWAKVKYNGYTGWVHKEFLN